MSLSKKSSNHSLTMYSKDALKLQKYTQNLFSISGTRSFRNWIYSKREAKFCLSLVILVFAISLQAANAIPVQSSGYRLALHTQQYRERRYQQLLQEQRSLAAPLPHRHHLHHRSVGIMPQTNSKREEGTSANGNGNEVGDYCHAIEATRDLIRKARRQANATFFNFYSSLGSYTQAKHNETAEKFYEQWSKHSLGLEHPYASHIDRNINVEPKIANTSPKHLVGQKITNETLATEFLNINKTLTILDYVYQEQKKERNKPRARFDLRRENESDEQFQERIKILDTIFENVYTFLQQDLFHTRNVLQSLNIQPDTDFEVSYNREAQQTEWLLFQEHLSVMKYLIEIYTFLLEHCDGGL